MISPKFSLALRSEREFYDFLENLVKGFYRNSSPDFRILPVVGFLNSFEWQMKVMERFHLGDLHARIPGYCLHIQEAQIRYFTLMFEALNQDDTDCLLMFTFSAKKTEGYKTNIIRTKNQSPRVVGWKEISGDANPLCKQANLNLRTALNCINN